MLLITRLIYTQSKNLTKIGNQKENKSTNKFHIYPTQRALKMATRQFRLKLYHFAPKLWSLLTKPLDSVMNMCTFAWTKKNILHGQSKILLNSASIFCVFSLLMFKNEQNFKKWINLEHSPKLALPSPSMEGWGEEQFLYVQWISKLIYKINNSELMNASQVNVSWPGRDSTRSSAKLSLAYK